MHLQRNFSPVTDEMWLTEDLDKAIDVLKSGGVILFPTDTIWGIGCDATNSTAIARIYKIKKRPADKPMVILADSTAMIKRYVKGIHPRVETLLSFHERPLTVIYPARNLLPGQLISENSTVAIRIPEDPLCIVLIGRLGVPVVATSANVSGDPFPKGFGEVSSTIIKQVDYVMKHRQEEKVTGEPSVIARFNKRGQLQFLRE